MATTEHETTTRRKRHRNPNGEPMPMHSFKGDGDEWDRACERAAENGETISDVLRRAVANYAATGRL